MEIKWIRTEKMWCDIINEQKQGQVFPEFHGYLMNVPINYDDEAERLLTNPDILPRVEAATTLYANDKSILVKSQRVKKRASVSFAKYVLFKNKFTMKYIWYTKRSLSQKVQNPTSTPLKNCMSVLDYYESKQSARSLKERSRPKSDVCHCTREQTKSVHRLAQDKPHSYDVVRQWGI